MTVSEVLREANKIAEKELEIFHRAMKSLQEEEQRRNGMIDFTVEGRVGDKVKSLLGGEGLITDICKGEMFPIKVSHANGKYIRYDMHGYSNGCHDAFALSFANGSISIDQGSPPERESERLYCGLTNQQWLRVIDEEFLVGFSDNCIKYSKVKLGTDTLKEIRTHDARYPFVAKSEAGWRFAAIPDTKGIRKPHFGGGCPTTYKGFIAYRVRNGKWFLRNLVECTLNWVHTDSGGDVMEYIELP